MISNKTNEEGTEIFIETGRYAVGKSGIYVTKVMDKKTSYGKTFVILNNTLNNAFEFIPLKVTTEFEVVIFN